MSTRTRCQDCDGDGLMVVGWDADAYENIEGPCHCAAGRRRAADIAIAQFLQPRHWCPTCGDGYATEMARDACAELHTYAAPR